MFKEDFDMAFNPNAEKYNKITQFRRLPVLLLLDVSGSMQGAPITALNDATQEMIREFSIDINGEQGIDMAFITFDNKATLHQNVKFKPAKEWRDDGFHRFSAGGNTNLEMALEMAYDMLEDPDTFSGKIYKPAIILVSDGAPNSGWENSFQKFITQGKASKAERFAVAIGNKADKNMLLKFVENPSDSEDQPQTRLYEADTAGEIVKMFKLISMSVSQRAVSKNPNIPLNTNKPVSPEGVSGASNVVTPVQSTKSRSNIDDDDDFS